MVAILVCAAVLFMVGYFAALCGAEIMWWLRDRVQPRQRVEVRASAVARRQIVTR
jgi:hypothetical protein